MSGFSCFSRRCGRLLKILLITAFIPRVAFPIPDRGTIETFYEAPDFKSEVGQYLLGCAGQPRLTGRRTNFMYYESYSCGNARILPVQQCMVCPDNSGRSCVVQTCPPSMATDTGPARRINPPLGAVEERAQRSVTEDPALRGNFPSGWAIDRPTAPPTPSDESELGEFREQYDNHKVLFAPTIEEDLAPGAAETIELPVPGPCGLSASVRWVGTINPLNVTIALNGSPVGARGTTYHFGTNRGGSLVSARTTEGGRATVTVTNTSGATVKVRIVFTGATT
jgi:hypothetical protein